MTKYQNFPEQNNLIYHIGGADTDPNICNCPFDNTKYITQTWNWYNTFGEPVQCLYNGYTDLYSTSLIADSRIPYIYTSNYNSEKMTPTYDIGFMVCRKQSDAPISRMTGWVMFTEAKPGCCIRIFNGCYIEHERKADINKDTSYTNIENSRIIGPVGAYNATTDTYDAPDISFIETGKWYYFDTYNWNITNSNDSKFCMPMFTSWYCARDDKYYRYGSQVYGVNDKYNVLKAASDTTPANGFLGIGFSVPQWSGVYLSDLRWYSSTTSNSFHKAYYFSKTSSSVTGSSGVTAVTGTSNYALATTGEFVETGELATKFTVGKSGNFTIKSPGQFYETENSQLIWTKDKKIKINEMIEV